ncbi:MAG: transposase family protein [Actinobacteria bacterium]|nr:transposase family protein [Actinomycetota bacterium]
MPWARHGAGHTRELDDTAEWLALQCPKTAVTELLRRDMGSCPSPSSGNQLDGVAGNVRRRP